MPQEHAKCMTQVISCKTVWIQNGHRTTNKVFTRIRDDALFFPC